MAKSKTAPGWGAVCCLEPNARDQGVKVVLIVWLAR